MKKTPLEIAINAAGSARALAERIGVTPMAITQWKSRGVPARRVQAVVMACNGAVSAEDLRPDIFRAQVASPAACCADRRVQLAPDDHHGRRTTDPTDNEIQALRECGEKAVELAGRLAG